MNTALIILLNLVLNRIDSVYKRNADFATKEWSTPRTDIGEFL